eukprot:CAMPEP_0171334838 /NCGR_PEP_ID=MMETSP0878-20121228/4947_1 /TAXON_ID=67004 /ORGANISM="Thalassiosira weissflogii, Strain CCMP1336" /LENGTH=595 /DNA_ID=CAMNT_0011836015 /DNA_START=595 /DNA_END=2382 /DNA_ORIENTATION=+
MRMSGHTGAVRISVMGGNNYNGNSGGDNNNGASGGNAGNFSQVNSLIKNKNANMDSLGGEDTNDAANDWNSSTSTWNYHEFYNNLNQQNQQQKQEGFDDRNGIHHNDDKPNEDEQSIDDDFVPITIRGDPVGCLCAVRQIVPLVDRSHDPHVIFEIPIHKPKHNLLVGRKAIILAALSADHDVRIMIPPNPAMTASSVVDGGGQTTASSASGNDYNYWKQRSSQQVMNADAGSTMLFADTGTLGMTGAGTGDNLMMTSGPDISTNAPAATSSNIIQLEGEIDKVESCLVKMLNILAGERWVPSGVVSSTPVQKCDAMNNHNTKDNKKTVPSSPTPNNRKDKKSSTNSGASTTSGSNSTTSTKPSKKDNSTASDTTTSSSNKKNSSSDAKTNFSVNNAEAILTAKAGTPTSKLPSLGKIRQMQRKSNTVIRKKKVKISVPNDIDSANAKDAEPALVNEGDNDEKEGSEDGNFSGPKSAMQYIITGKLENVRSVANHFEKILGLSAGAALINEVSIENQPQEQAAPNNSTSDINVSNTENIKATEEKSSGGTPNPGGVAGGGRNRKRGPRKGGRGGSYVRKNAIESQNALEGGGDGM